jgi:DNA-binding CsgD family transcriptional regulator/PAS domain-containing protein
MKSAMCPRPSPDSALATEDISYDNQQLSDLIGDIYDAVLDQSLWPDILRRSASFVGGSGAALFSKDAAAQLGDVHHDIGIDPFYKQLYYDKYLTLDPATTGHIFAELEEPMATGDFMSYDEFLETRFYKEWVRPQGLVDFVTSVLDKSATGVAMFGVFRHERNGAVDAEARRRMRLIVPHIRRAVLICRMFDLKAAEAITFADTLDGLSAAMCLVSAEGRVVHANSAAHAMLGEGDILRTVAGKLVARDTDVDQTLRDVFSAAGRGDAALGTKGIAVPLMAKDGERYVAHALPLTSGARGRAGLGHSAAVALFVRRASVMTSSPPEVIGKAFKLTPTELRVLLAIVEVGGVPEVAVALGVAETTIKTHLSRLFEKTGATRQADLVKLVAGYATPLTE